MVSDRKLYIILAILLIVSSFGVFYLYGGLTRSIPMEFRGNRYIDPIEALDFQLIDQFGRLFKLSDYRGKVIAITFIYTHCPDICPAISVGFYQLNNLLRENGLDEDVVLVMVTVDPERDTPDRLKMWMDLYGLENVYLLTGELDEVSKVWMAYGVYVEKVEVDDPDLGYLVAHTGVVYLINRDFEVEVFFLGAPPQWSAEDIFNDIRILAARAPKS